MEQAFGIRTVSHVLSIGGAGITDPQQATLPKPEDLEALDASPVRTLDKNAEERMIARIDEAKENADTLGGVIEVVVYGVPAGVGTYVESDRRLDAALASAVMGIQPSRAWRSVMVSLRPCVRVLRLMTKWWWAMTAVLRV